LQRWINRDPLDDAAFDLGERSRSLVNMATEPVRRANSFTFARNRIGSTIDPFGLAIIEILEPATPIAGKNPFRCKITSLENHPAPQGAQGPGGKVCGYSCTGGNGSDEAANRFPVTIVVECGSHCPNPVDIADGLEKGAPRH